MDLRERCEKATAITEEAGRLALDFFRRQDRLRIDSKGHQDFVSQADREVEDQIRAALARVFPGDGILGEEHPPSAGSSGFTWVIDPIDGTANFVSAIPAWCVVLAGVSEGRTQIGIIHDPCHAETYVAIAGAGASLNGVPMRLPPGRSLQSGSVGVGFSGRVDPQTVIRLIGGIVAEGGIFYRNASGALSLAYVASGRLLGYSEAHMNAWDCLAGQLLVAEAGGVVEEQDANDMMADGGRVIVGAPGVFEPLLRISEAAFAG